MSRRASADATMPRAKRARPSAAGVDAAGVDAAGVLAEELQCNVCLGLLCRPHALNCGHAFCGACIHAHAAAKRTAWENLDCPVCREVLSCDSEPPLLQVQISAAIDRMREACPGTVLDESLGEWHERQARWDADAAEARALWRRGAAGARMPDPESEDENPHIEAQRRHNAAFGRDALSLRVESTSGADAIVFHCHRLTELGHLKGHYCDLTRYRRHELEFVYYRQRVLRSRVAERAHVVRDDDTGEGLGMSNGDVIVARRLLPEDDDEPFYEDPYGWYGPGAVGGF